MQKSTDYCKLPGRYGYKWPTLSELHITLFGKDFEDAHNAMGDVIATENCFWKLRDLGIV
jgi:DNA polymerase-3 subunit epsilon